MHVQSVTSNSVSIVETESVLGVSKLFILFSIYRGVLNTVVGVFGDLNIPDDKNVILTNDANYWITEFWKFLLFQFRSPNTDIQP
jgi:hypothetical protein